MVTIREVKSEEKKLIDEIVTIHLNTFTGFFLTFMGRGFLRQMYRYGVKYKNVDVIFANSTPPTQGMLAVFVKQKLSKNKNIPFIYCLQDIFPDSLVNAKMTSKGSLIWKIGRKIEDYTYKSADEIITISDGLCFGFKESKNIQRETSMVKIV